MSYTEFLERRSQLGGEHGFAPVFMPDHLFPFQQSLVEWAVRKGRAAIFADCGLGKTPMQLAWAENIVRQTNGRVLIITPLAVSHQTVREGAKFGTEVRRSDDGTAHPGITVTNYERLHLFNSADFVGTVCDESSAIKSFDGTRRKIVTEFMRKHAYRLLCTATAAPNDYIELGTASEALGYLGQVDMLGRFFKNDNNTIDMKGRMKGYGAPRVHQKPGWRLKGHAETPFWRWVSSWARAVRRPSDLGFDDGGYSLPALTEAEHVIKSRTIRPGYLFDLPAMGLDEEREEARRTLPERCEAVASLVNETGQPAVVWCFLNDEGDTLQKMIPDAVQVSGSDSDEVKEARLLAFQNGDARILISKPKIAAWGLNWQHCNHMTFFPTHSFESYYQGVRRCWRYGQQRPVTVDIVTTEGGSAVMESLRTKAAAADAMFDSIVSHMHDAQAVARLTEYTKPMEAPTWL